MDAAFELRDLEKVFYPLALKEVTPNTTKVASTAPTAPQPTEKTVVVVSLPADKSIVSTSQTATKPTTSTSQPAKESEQEQDDTNPKTVS